MATVLEPRLARRSAPESSDRGFGLVFAAAFALVGILPVLHWGAPRWWALGVAVAFALVALLLPSVLHPLNYIWLALGRLLHRIVSPLVMGMIFFLCVTPIGWTMRLLGNDILSLKRRNDLSTYWIVRTPTSPPTDRMKNQF